VGLLYDDTSIEADLLQPEWSTYDMPLESQDSLPWGLAVRLGQPEWSAYMSKMVEKWSKDGTILDLESKYHIKHSQFAEDMHKKYSGQ
jgi:polar amino acid transport system substrate-binding protein